MIAAWVVVAVPGGALAVVPRVAYKRNRSLAYISSHRTEANARKAKARHEAEAAMQRPRQ